MGGLNGLVAQFATCTLPCLTGQSRISISLKDRMRYAICSHQRNNTCGHKLAIPATEGRGLGRALDVGPLGGSMTSSMGCLCRNPAREENSRGLDSRRKLLESEVDGTFGTREKKSHGSIATVRTAQTIQSMYNPPIELLDPKSRSPRGVGVPKPDPRPVPNPYRPSRNTNSKQKEQNSNGFGGIAAGGKGEGPSRLDLSDQHHDRKRGDMPDIFDTDNHRRTDKNTKDELFFNGESVEIYSQSNEAWVVGVVIMIQKTLAGAWVTVQYRDRRTGAPKRKRVLAHDGEVIRHIRTKKENLNETKKQKELSALRISLNNHGADPDKGNKIGETKLHEAAELGLTEIVGELLRAKANPNVRTKFGCVALHYAGYLGDVSMIRSLLFAKADPSVANSQGETPVDYCMVGSTASSKQGKNHDAALSVLTHALQRAKHKR
ncbi:hypothetical protein AAMO2058_000208300 [Amorphochlora amoebiformis]